MQSKKGSHTIRKGADVPVDVASQTSVAETGGTSRTSRSKAKKAETSDLGSVRHRKSRANDDREALQSNADNLAPIVGPEASGGSPVTAVERPSKEEVEKLAYSFWEARGFEHGFADQDWLRAENELSARA
jgi:hypothetical protein